MTEFPADLNPLLYLAHKKIRAATSSSTACYMCWLFLSKKDSTLTLENLLGCEHVQ